MNFSSLVFIGNILFIWLSKLQSESIDVVDRSLDTLNTTRDDITTTTTTETTKQIKKPKDELGPKPKPKPTAAENEQCICEICTCG